MKITSITENSGDNSYCDINLSWEITVSFNANFSFKSLRIPSNDILCSFSNSYSSSSSLGMKSLDFFSAFGIQNILITILSKFTQYNF